MRTSSCLRRAAHICTLLIHVEKFHSNTFKHFVSESLDFMIQPWKYENFYFIFLFAPSVLHYIFYLSLISPPLSVAGTVRGFGVVHVSHRSWIKASGLNEGRWTSASSRHIVPLMKLRLRRWCRLWLVGSTTTGPMNRHVLPRQSNELPVLLHSHSQWDWTGVESLFCKVGNKFLFSSLFLTKSRRKCCISHFNWCFRTGAKESLALFSAATDMKIFKKSSENTDVQPFFFKYLL